MTSIKVECSDKEHKRHAECDFLSCTRCGKVTCRWVDGPWTLGTLGIYGVLGGEWLCEKCIDAFRALVCGFVSDQSSEL